MKNKLIILVVFICFADYNQAQHFDWVVETPISSKWFTFGEMAIDESQNIYIVGHTSACTDNSCRTYHVAKYDKDGNLKWTHNNWGLGQSGTMAGTSVDSDSNRNVYALLYLSKYSPPDPPFEYTVGTDTIQLSSITGVANILIKYDSTGTILWTEKISEEGKDHIVVSNSGNVIVTNETLGTRAYDSTGSLVWNNSQYGGDIVKYNDNDDVIILSTDSLTKLDSSGAFIWSQPYGGLDLACSSSGDSYVAALDSIFIVDNNGVFQNSFPTDTSTKITVDQNGGIYYLKEQGFDYGAQNEVTLFHLDSSGTTTLYYFDLLQAGDLYYSNSSMNGDALFFISQASLNTFMCPEFYEGHFSIPFVIASKISTNYLPVLGFPDLWYPNYGSNFIGEWSKCVGDTFNVSYSICNGSFNPGNSFILELSDATGDFSNPLVIGIANTNTGGTINTTIPSSVPSGIGYRVRIRSTNPVYISNDNGYDLPIDNLTNSISFSGFQTTVCRDLKKLTCNLAGVQYQWERDGVPIAGATNQVYSPNIVGTGTFRVLVSNNSGCSSYSSNDYTLDVLPRPWVTITNNGNPFVCVGDSVELSATSPNAILYRWKRYNATVSGPNNNTMYYAKKGGTYKVIVTDINGCTRVSNKIDIESTPSGKITVSGPLTFCQGDSVTLNASIGIGYTYQWKKYGNIIIGATQPFYTATSSGKYKCIITDLNGCETPTQVKTVTVNSCPARYVNDMLYFENAIEVYPNPAFEKFTISFGNISKGNIATLEVRDIIGKLMYHQSISNEKLIRIKSNEFESGIYTIRVKFDDGKVVNKKVSIMH